jgi:hypothetical protein
MDSPKEVFQTCPRGRWRLHDGKARRPPDAHYATGGDVSL